MKKHFLAISFLAAACGSKTTTFEQSEHWPADTTYPGVGDGRVLITNNFDDTLSIFDLAQISDPNQKELLRIPVGSVPVELEGPHHAAMDPAGEYYYIGISNFVPNSGSGPHGSHGGGSEDGYVLKYRASDNRLVQQARVDPNPGDVAVSADGKSIFVSHYDLLRITEGMRTGDESKMNANLAIVDAETMETRPRVTLCPAPHGLLPSPDGRYVYVACYTDELAIVDLQSNSTTAERVKVALDAGAGVTDAVYRPYAVAIHPVNGDVYVSGTQGRKILIFDAETRMMDHARALDIDGMPIFGTFTADGSTFYVTHQNPDGIAIIDTATNTLVEDVRLPAPVCIAPHEVLLAPGESYALLVCEGDHIAPGTFVVLEVKPGDLDYHHHVAVGIFPDYIGILKKP